MSTTEEVSESSSDGRQVGGRDLPTAIIVGVLLAALFLGSLFAGKVWLTLVITLLIVPAMWEAAKELEGVGIKVEPFAVMLGPVAIVWLTYNDGQGGQASGVMICFALAVAAQLLDQERTDVLRRMAISLFLMVWVGLLASYAILLRSLPDGQIAALAVIGAAIFGDIGAFAVGVKFGRTKVAPSLSPNKSVEGLVGGLVVAGLLAALVLPGQSVLFDVTSAVIVGLLAALGGFFGDLVESMIKRDLGIKDFGRLIPGHGGVLDRVDGILVALPIGWFAIRQFVF